MEYSETCPPTRANCVIPAAPGYVLIQWCEFFADYPRDTVHVWGVPIVGWRIDAEGQAQPVAPFSEIGDGTEYAIQAPEGLVYSPYYQTAALAEFQKTLNEALAELKAEHKRKAA